MSMKKTTSRNYALVLPASWENKDKIIDRCKEIAKHYYVILHDSDADENGELKKEHYHILMAFSSPQQINTVFNKFAEFTEIKQNSIELIRNGNGYKRYLCHVDNPEKHQYPSDLVITNDSLYKDALINKISACDEVNNLMDAFDKKNSVKSEREYIEAFKSAFIQMNSYQRLMSIIALKRDYRNK